MARKRSKFPGNVVSGAPVQAAKTEGFRALLWQALDRACRYLAFVDERGQEMAFLLSDWNGRAGFTVTAFAELSGRFIIEVAIIVTDLGHFTRVGAMLGKLRVVNNRPCLTTVNAQGEIAVAAVAPLYAQEEDEGEYEYCWALVGKSDPPKDVRVRYTPRAEHSWLNNWFSREYQSEAHDCPFCERDSLEMLIPAACVEVDDGIGLLVPRG